MIKKFCDQHNTQNLINKLNASDIQELNTIL